jgi:hypothetical protein
MRAIRIASAVLFLFLLQQAAALGGVPKTIFAEEFTATW